MEKIFYLCILVNFSFLTTLSAQLEKGGFMLEGSIFLGFDDEDEFIDNSSISTPKVGYFVADNILLGAGIGLRTQKENSQFGNDASTSQFNFSPFSRFYFGHGKLKPFGQIDLDFNRIKIKNSSFENSESSTNVFLSLGFDYFLSPNVALETSFRFRVNENSDFFSFPNNQLDIYLGEEFRTNFSLGFKFFLNNQTEKGTAASTEPLVSRYLQTGNQSIGLSGLGLLIDGDYLLIGGVTWQKFTREKRRWSHYFGAFLANDLFFDDGFNGIFTYRPEFELFIGVTPNTFLVPSIGVNLGTALSEPTKNAFFGGTFHPKLIHFFNNALMEIGLDVQTPITDFEEETNDWSGQFILAGEYFIQNDLSLRGEINVRAFGASNLQDLNEQFLLQYSPKSRFTIGFNYFFNKGNKSGEEEPEGK